MINQSPADDLWVNKDIKQSSLFIVFKYVAIGSGILGIGFLIAIAGFLLSH